MLKTYLDLTKFGIVIFVLIAGLAGYVTGFQFETAFSFAHLLQFLLGLYLVSSGSLAMNQLQEWRIDQKMPRTRKRPIASGKIKPVAGGILAVCFILAGLQQLYIVSVFSAWIGFFSVIFYNIFYTMWWKKSWAYAAIPGALPGTLPVTMGYVATNPDVFSYESVYLFLVLFLWQMPHFWVLALKYKDDYAAGGIPVLPVAKGRKKTVQQIGIYTVGFVGIALLSPLFVHASWCYYFFVLPISCKVFLEFLRFQKREDDKNWLRFFLWTNLAVLVYLITPVLDKWNFVLGY